MREKLFENFDFVLVILVLLLTLTGVAFIYSSGVNSEKILVTHEYIKQIVWAAIGMIFMILFAFFDYRKLEKVAFPLYMLFIFVLLLTTFFGKHVNGARSWIGIGSLGVQPSELGKVAYILMLAKYLASSMEAPPIKRLLISCFIMSLPAIFILMQPDLGTAVVYIPIFFLMCLMANVDGKALLFLFLIGVFTIIFTILPVWNTFLMHGKVEIINLIFTGKYKFFIFAVCFIIFILSFVAYKFLRAPRYLAVFTYVFAVLSAAFLASYAASKVLKEYQIQRLIVFINPKVDAQGAGWNIIQSKIAIGSGGFRGKGFLGGTQSHFRFLPQQATDFIFSIFAEESGFLGGIFLFTCYFILMLKILKIIKNTANPFGIYIASGVLAMFLVHFFINVGMVMGIMPITGIPFLFVSYGGSSLLTSMICVGLALSVNYRHMELK